MADAFDQSISFTGQKRRVRPVRRVQVSTHFGDLNTQTISLATPPPPAPEPMILTEASNTSDMKLPQVKEAGYATKPEESPIDEFSFLTGIMPKQKPAESEKRPDSKTESKPVSPEAKTEAKPLSPEAKTVPPEATTVIPKVKTLTPPPELKKTEISKTQPAITTATNAKEPEMTEIKTAPALAAVKTSEKPAVMIVAPPVPQRMERKSFVSVNSEGPRMDFTDSDAGAIQQRTSMVESDFSGSKRVSLTDSASSAGFENVSSGIKEPEAEKVSNQLIDTTKLGLSNQLIDTKKPEAERLAERPKRAKEEVVQLKDTKAEDTKKAANQANYANEPEVKKATAVAPPPASKEILTPAAPTPVKDKFCESLKPRMLPVLPIAQAASKQPEGFTPSPPIVSSNIRPSSVVSNNGKIPLATGKDGKTSPIKLATYQPQNEELGRLKENFVKQAQLLEKERKDRMKLEHQFEALKAKCEAQDEALRYKNEKVSKMEQEFIGLKNEVTGLKMERDRIQSRLQIAETEMKEVSGSNAVEFIEKSDQVNKLKEQLDNLAYAISEKDKEISILNAQLKDSQDSHINVIFDSLNALRSFDDEFITVVEAEILKMENLLKDESEYNSKLQKEVESEYAFWKRTLSENKP